MDLSISEWLNHLAVHRDGLEDVLVLVARNAEYVFVGLLGGLFLARGRWTSREARRGVVAAVAAAALALLVAHFIGVAWNRPRPFVAHPHQVQIFAAHARDASFPSDHATAAFAIAVSIWLRCRRIGWVLIAAAALLEVSRVVVGLHYPSDVLAGAILGTGTALLLWWAPIRFRLRALADRAGCRYELAVNPLAGFGVGQHWI